MKWLGLFISICFFIFACVSEYEPSSIEIRLSRSVKILDDFGEEESITDANVFIECDQGFTFEPVSVSEEGVYILKVDKLEPAYKYRLSINWNDKEYKSEYLSPLDTPAIDSISVESPASENLSIFVSRHMIMSLNLLIINGVIGKYGNLTQICLRTPDI